MWSTRSMSGARPGRAAGRVLLRIEDHDRQRSRRRVRGGDSRGSGVARVRGRRAGRCGRASVGRFTRRRWSGCGAWGWCTRAAVRGPRSHGGPEGLAPTNRGPEGGPSGPPPPTPNCAIPAPAPTAGWPKARASGCGCGSSRPSNGSSTCATARRSSARRSNAATCWCATATATGRISSRRRSTIWSRASRSSIRGDDLLASTGRQIQLARLLGRDEPPRVPAPPADHEIGGPETEQVGRRHRRPRPARAGLDA